MNTTDASMGNVISGNQVRALPLEGRNVVGLLSLQPGATYLPNSSEFDNRNGAVSGARADQANITLDGVDANDPEFGTAYTAALRTTLDSLEEFRVTTSNYGADSGRSSSAQVSLVTKGGTNIFHGAGYTRPPQHVDLVERVFQQAGGPRRAEARQTDLRRIARRPHHERQAVLLLQLRAH